MIPSSWVSGAWLLSHREPLWISPFLSGYLHSSLDISIPLSFLPPIILSWPPTQPKQEENIVQYRFLEKIFIVSSNHWWWTQWHGDILAWSRIEEWRSYGFLHLACRAAARASPQDDYTGTTAETGRGQSLTTQRRAKIHTLTRLAARSKAL